MAVRKYVSVLSLLNDIIPLLQKKETGNNGYRFPRLSIVVNGISPLFELIEKEEVLKTGTTENTHPLDKLRKELTKEQEDVNADTDGLRQIRTTANLWRNVKRGTQLNVPYLLEMEFLKDSDFSKDTYGTAFGEKEWDLVEQLMYLYLGNWYFAMDQSGFYLERNPDELLGELMTQDKVLEFDLEVPEEKEKAMKQIKKAYRSGHFSIGQTSPNSYMIRQADCWTVAPLSVMDAFMTMRSNVYERFTGFGSLAAWSSCLLFLPIVMVLSLLERETETFLAFDYKNYARYEGMMLPNMSGENTNDTYQTFTYGLADRYQSFGSFEDREMMLKVQSHILNAMKVLAVDKNIPTLSVNSDSIWEKKVPKTSVLLNKTNLSWDD